jgi:hypothetical protein
MSFYKRYIKVWFEPVGLFLLLLSFGWQCFEVHSAGRRTDSYVYELNEKLIAIWSAEYDQALKSDRYHSNALVSVNYDVLNRSIKDWNQIQNELNTISKQSNLAFYARLVLYILGSVLVLLTKIPQKENHS